AATDEQQTRPDDRESPHRPLLRPFGRRVRGGDAARNELCVIFSRAVYTRDFRGKLMAVSQACPSHEELVAFAWGRLSSVARSSVEEHLHACPACDATAKRAIATGDTALGPGEAPSALDWDPGAPA